MTATELQTEALDRARNGQSMTNYSAIYSGFAAKGIPASEIEPRVNVLTFHAWKAVGRSVKKGEHGVKVVTFVEMSGRDTVEPGEEIRTWRSPRTTTVFHISQTEATADREARGGWKRAEGRQPRSNAASGHGRYPMTDSAGYPDPGELAQDRWTETH